MKKGFVWVILFTLLIGAAIAQSETIQSGFVTPGEHRYFFPTEDGAQQYIDAQIRVGKEQLREYIQIFGLGSKQVELKSMEIEWWESVILLDASELQSEM